MKRSGFKPKPCSECGSIYHTMGYHRPRKPLKKVGKVGNQWLKTRNKWLEQNKSLYYFCFYCTKPMTRSQLTLDHKLSRSRHPELRNKLSNLVPCCLACNQDKGSLSSEEYLDKKVVDTAT